MSVRPSHRSWLGRAGVLLMLAGGIGPRASWAEPVTLIRSSGSSANRVDIVLLGDGYSAADIANGTYEQHVELFLTRVMGQEPYQEYQNYFNVWRVDVTSAESGSDHPESGIYRNTALDSAYNCGGIQRLICVNTSKVYSVLANSGVAANARDMIIVLVNDPAYGGSGGPIAVASTNTSAAEIILHEEGHSFALLADEYGGPPPPACDPAEPSAVNVTAQTDRASIKWGAWIDPATPVPTTGTSAGIPGLYQGARYCDQGLYRSTYNSKMRSLGRPFDAINAEQHVRRIYNLVSPIDDWSPSATTVDMSAELPVTLSVAILSPWTHSLDAVWTVDGAPITGATTEYAARGLGAGTHQVVATVRDATAIVRDDPSGLLTDTHSWTLRVTSTPLTFTDDPLTALGTLVKAVHITELRQRIDTLRARVALLAFSWTDPTITTGVTVIKAIHLTELRTALNAVYAAAGRTAPAYTNPTVTPGLTVIAGVHIAELRAAVRAVW
jgi:hypothetical protein